MRYLRRDGTETISYTESEREQALNISLTSLAAYLGYTPVRSGAHYHLKEMDSLVIYNDRTWNRWSKKGSITGGTTIDFFMAFGGASSVPEAIQDLLEMNGSAQVAKREEAPHRDRKETVRDFTLPPRNDNYRRLFAYLIQTRGLSQDVVSDFVHRHLIYEDAVHHNIVYCGMDPEGTVRYAGLRGTADIYGKKFKMDVPGNDKNYGVNIVNRESDTVKVFESVIDCMSYIDLTGDKTSNKLVLGMVEDNPLARFVKDYPHIHRIVLCLDNDEAGRNAINGDEKRIGLKEKYEREGFSVAVELPTDGKDFNEQLLSKKNESFKVNQPLIGGIEMNMDRSIYDQMRGIYSVGDHIKTMAKNEEVEGVIVDAIKINGNHYETEPSFFRIMLSSGKEIIQTPAMLGKVVLKNNVYENADFKAFVDFIKGNEEKYKKNKYQYSFLEYLSRDNKWVSVFPLMADNEKPYEDFAKDIMNICYGAYKKYEEKMILNQEECSSMSQSFAEFLAKELVLVHGVKAPKNLNEVWVNPLTLDVPEKSINDNLQQSGTEQAKIAKPFRRGGR